MGKNDEIVNDYASGLSIRKVAKKHDVNDWVVQKALKAAGVELRTQSSAGRLAHGSRALSPDLEQQIAADYMSGLSIHGCATKSGVSHTEVVRVLAETNTPLRSLSAAQALANPNLTLTPERRAAIIRRYKDGDSTIVLEGAFGVSRSVITSVLLEAGVPTRSKKSAAMIAKPKHVLDERHRAALTMLVDGLMLGDGHITSGGELSISQTVARLGWIDAVSALLTSFGVEHRVDPREARRRITTFKGRIIEQGDYVQLRTRAYDLFLAQRERWYEGPSNRTHSHRELRVLRKTETIGTKIVPPNLVLTPVSVGHWFNGDGSAWANGGLCFSTHSFTNEEVFLLSRFLKRDFGIESNVINAVVGEPDQFVLHIGRRDDAVKLRDLIIAHVPECCLYKFDDIRAAKGFDRGGHVHKGIDWDKQPLGATTDMALARILDVSENAVSVARRRRGIKAFRDREGGDA